MDKNPSHSVSFLGVEVYTVSSVIKHSRQCRVSSCSMGPEGQFSQNNLLHFSHLKALLDIACLH